MGSEQTSIGIYDLHATWEKEDAAAEGGIAYFKLDKCNAFQLVPKSCALTPEDM